MGTPLSDGNGEKGSLKKRFALSGCLSVCLKRRYGVFQAALYDESANKENGLIPPSDG